MLFSVKGHCQKSGLLGCIRKPKILHRAIRNVVKIDIFTMDRDKIRTPYCSVFSTMQMRQRMQQTTVGLHHRTRSVATPLPDIFEVQLMLRNLKIGASI